MKETVSAFLQRAWRAEQRRVHFPSCSPCQCPGRCRGWWQFPGGEERWRWWRGGRARSPGCCSSVCTRWTSSSCQRWDDLRWSETNQRRRLFGDVCRHIITYPHILTGYERKDFEWDICCTLRWFWNIIRDFSRVTQVYWSKSFSCIVISLPSTLVNYHVL